MLLLKGHKRGLRNTGPGPDFCRESRILFHWSGRPSRSLARVGRTRNDAFPAARRRLPSAFFELVPLRSTRHDSRADHVAGRFSPWGLLGITNLYVWNTLG